MYEISILSSNSGCGTVGDCSLAERNYAADYRIARHTVQPNTRTICDRNAIPHRFRYFALRNPSPKSKYFANLNGRLTLPRIQSVDRNIPACAIDARYR